MGVVWSIGEPIVNGVAQFSEAITWLRNGLYTNASTNLLAYAGNMLAEWSLLHSTIVAAAYLIVPFAVAAYVFRKRDMAG